VQPNSILSIPLPASGFIASIAEDQTFSVTAPTRNAAEDACRSTLSQQTPAKNPAESVSPEVWLRDLAYWPEEEEHIEEISIDPSEYDEAIPWSEVKARHGV